MKINIRCRLSGLTFLVIFISTQIICINISAQEQSDPSLLTIDRLFHNYEFVQERLGKIQWLDDGNFYTRLEPSENLPGGKDLVRYNSSNNKRDVLVPAEKLVPKGEESPLNIDSYSWSADGNKLLIFTNSHKVWRSNTRGDYWVYTMKSGKLSQIGKEMPEASLMFAKVSPNMKKVAYVSNFNIYIEDLKSGEVTALTTDGTRDIINGTFDWVYEEEFDARDGFRWSPNGKYIAAWQLDASSIKNFLMINNTDSIYSRVIPVQYPKTGQDPSSCRVGVINVETKERIWLKIPGDPVQHYIPRLQWVGDRVLVQQINRKQNHLKFWMCDPVTGQAKLIYEEKDEAWIDIMNNDVSFPNYHMSDLPLVDDGKYLMKLSEKDGWKHLYKIPLDGGDEVLLTPGEYDLGCVYAIDKDKGFVYISASPDNSTQRYLYQISLDGTGTHVRLTPKAYSGINDYFASPNGKYAIHSHSNANTPKTTYLLKLEDHSITTTLIDNQEYKDQIAQLNLSKYEFFQVTTKDGIELDGRMMKPIDFDPSKKYPVLFYVYGEPWGQTAIDSWRLGWDHLLSQMGYVIITMDNRGTPCLKGREWRKSIYEKIGIINSYDQAMAAREILKWDFVDPDRIAVWGWSGGGSMTLNLMFRYPEIYKTGLSVAPVANALFYDNIYQERYMGLPQENMDAYVEGSPITHAKNLEGNLLLVHGTGDDNVHYQNAEALINELIKHNKQFQVMPYPNRSHGIYEGENTRRHLYTLLTNYLIKNCEPGGK